MGSAGQTSACRGKPFKKYERIQLSPAQKQRISHVTHEKQHTVEATWEHSGHNQVVLLCLASLEYKKKKQHNEGVNKMKMICDRFKKNKGWNCPAKPCRRVVCSTADTRGNSMETIKYSRQVSTAGGGNPQPNGGVCPTAGCSQHPPQNAAQEHGQPLREGPEP